MIQYFKKCTATHESKQGESLWLEMGECTVMPEAGFHGHSGPRAKQVLVQGRTWWVRTLGRGRKLPTQERVEVTHPSLPPTHSGLRLGMSFLPRMGPATYSYQARPPVPPCAAPDLGCRGRLRPDQVPAPGTAFQAGGNSWQRALQERPYSG